MKTDEHYRKYHIPGCNNYMKRPKNSVILSSANSVKHELAKTLAAYMLNKYGDVKFNEMMVQLLNQLDDAVEIALRDWEKNPAEFITEAVPNDEPKRRVDLVRLSDGRRFEFETDKKVLKSGEDTTTFYL